MPSRDQGNACRLRTSTAASVMKNDCIRLSGDSRCRGIDSSQSHLQLWSLKGGSGRTIRQVRRENARAANIVPGDTLVVGRLRN